MGFYDSITSLISTLANRRSQRSTTRVDATRVEYHELRAMYRTGIGSRIVRIKSGHALRDTLEFESEDDRRFYAANLADDVRTLVAWMIAFGRSVAVIHEVRDADLRAPIPESVDIDRGHVSIWPGDEVTVSDVSFDPRDPRFHQPRLYHVRGMPVHPSRVVDFRYVEPPTRDAPVYRWGGIPEFELIRDQIVNDEIVARAVPRIMDVGSSVFYKIKGFKNAMSSGKEDDMVKYFGRIEDGRGIFGSGLLDADDEVLNIDQTLSNMGDSDQITLRRLALVTGIPMARLVGENVRGLNSTGQNEEQAFQDTLREIQESYIIGPVNKLMAKLGRGTVKAKENQGWTQITRINFESSAIQNARLLWEMGEDPRSYLEYHSVIQVDSFDEIFPDVDSMFPDPSEAPASARNPKDLLESIGGEDPDAEADT